MNVQAHLQMDKAAFLAWAQEHEGRFELVERRVVMMTGGSKAHALIASNLAREHFRDESRGGGGQFAARPADGVDDDARIAQAFKAHIDGEVRAQHDPLFEIEARP